MACASEGKLAYLTDFTNQALELITIPVLKSDTIIKTGNSFHLVSVSKSRFIRKQIIIGHPQQQKTA